MPIKSVAPLAEKSGNLDPNFIDANAEAVVIETGTDISTADAYVAARSGSSLVSAQAGTSPSDGSLAVPAAEEFVLTPEAAPAVTPVSHDVAAGPQIEIARVVTGPIAAPGPTSEFDAAPGPAGSIQTLANYLSSGYWADTGRTMRYFNVTDSGTGANNGVLYYNLSGFSQDSNGLTDARKVLAREAFDFYEAILGINFVETSSTGTDVDFFFKDNDLGQAYNSTTVYSGTGGPIDYNVINVASNWDGGTSYGNDYTLQTFIHEIGHGLGLGHQGNYNAGVGTPTYANSAIWANDSWQLSIMSYWSQTENPTTGASFSYLISSAAADIVALNTLYSSQGYGTAANAYTGNTTWGVGTNITTGPFSDLGSWYTSNAFTIIDGGGTDTLNFSSTSANQLIDLTIASSASTTGTVSNVGGRTGNMTLAVGVVIENATSGGGNDTLIGNTATNALRGGSGNDTINARSGNDSVYGDDGNDTLIYTTGEGYDHFYGGSGTDTAYFGSYANMTINLDTELWKGSDNAATFAASSIEIVYSGSMNDTITGTYATQELHGGGGNDTFVSLVGRYYDDVYGDAGNDTLDHSASDYSGDTFNFLTSTYTGTHTNSGTGALQSIETYRDGSGGNTIISDGFSHTYYGNGGDDLMIASSGGETMDGGSGGNDTIDLTVGNFIYSNFNMATGLASDYSAELFTNFEVALMPNTANNVIGNSANNAIYGNGGADYISGGEGVDSVYGGDGNDVLEYVTNEAYDHFYGGADIDTVILGTFSSNTFIVNLAAGRWGYNGTLAFDMQDVENVTTGNNADTVVGSNVANTIIARGGADSLNGGAGVDRLEGGTGSDTYVVDVGGDVVIEADGEGTDLVLTTATYALAAGQSIETLQLASSTGSQALNLAGNEIGNVLIGNAGANAINGGGAADSMQGLGGNDTYIVDIAGDVVVEANNAGTDIVLTTVSYALAANQSVETLQLASSTGTAALNITGNNIGNVLIGNAGANVLNGGSAADLLQGGLGNDSYLVDDAADVVQEAFGLNTGVDTVVSTVSYALSAGQYVENLQFASSVGAAALNLTGNELANTIFGNGGANAIQGLAGADTIVGGGGRDTLVPGTDGDMDTIHFANLADSTGGNRDMVLSADFNNEDKLVFAIKPTVFLGVVTTGALNNGANFDIEIGTAVNGLLGAGGAVEAVLFDPSSGGLNEAGHSYLVVDANNDGSYTAGADWLVELVNYTGTLDATDFI